MADVKMNINLTHCIGKGGQSILGLNQVLILN